MLARLRDRSKGSVDDVQGRNQDDLLRMTRREWFSAEYTTLEKELTMCKVEVKMTCCK